MNINPIATEGVKPIDITPFVPVEVEGDNLDLRSDQVVPAIKESDLETLNESVKPHNIRFEMKNDKMVMIMVDAENDDVIREIPNTRFSELVVKLKEAIQTGKNLGIFIDTFV